jgi:hypothetical protein
LSQPKRSAIPFGAIGMIALLGSIESVVARHWIDLTDPVSLSWRYSAQSAENEARECQVLCLGDSLVKHGLIPSVMDRATGQRTVNLSAAQASTLLTQSLLRRALESGARPNALIVNAKPAVLLGGPEVNARAWQEVVSLRDGLELMRMTGNAPFVASTLVGRLFPSLRSRLEIRSAITAALSGETDKISAINPVLWRNWSVNGGANVASAAAPFPGDVTAEVRQQLYTDLFYVDPANAQAIEGILEIAAERQIPIFWVLFPLSPKLQALRDQSGADERHDQFLRSIAARQSGELTVLDARHSGYPAAFFADATHLNRLGAIALSWSVAAALVTSGELPPKAPGSDPAWIAVGAPIKSAAGWNDAIEDVDQSRRIVRSGPATRVSSR